MINFIPIIYLPEYVFPGEILNIHITQDQVKHLITDCYGENKPFGIIPINEGKGNFGNLVSIENIHEVWNDQKMNITLRGVSIFQTLEEISNIPNKLYNGAIVTYPNNTLETTIPVLPKVQELLTKIDNVDILKFDQSLLISKNTSSYQIANYIALNKIQKQEFIQLLFESQRLEYIRIHLENIFPILVSIGKSILYKGNQRQFKQYPNI
jgi:uncharacterized protein